MAYYYILAGGTATGDAGRSETERTGGFASMGISAYYNSLKDIYADSGTTGNTGVASDDIVRVSHLHDRDYGATTSIGITSSNIQSVDDLNANEYKKGALERTSSGSISVLTDNDNVSAISGVSFNSLGGLLGDWIVAGSRLYSEALDCDLLSDDGGRQFRFDSEGVYRFKRGTYQAGVGASTGGILARGRCELEFDGYVFSGGCLVSSESNSGVYLKIINSDLSALGANPFINLGAAITDGQNRIELRNCKLPVITQLLETGQINQRVTVDMFKCTDFLGIADGNYFEYHYSFYGESYTDTSVYLNYKYDGVNGASMKLESSANTSIGHPQKLKLCEIPSQNLSTTDTTYRVNLLLDTDTVAQLTDTTFWVELTHSNNTDLALGDVITSRNANILATGTELTISSEVFQGTLPTNTQAYQVDITLTAAQLTNVTNTGVVVYACLAAPNADVYVDPVVQIGT